MAIIARSGSRHERDDGLRGAIAVYDGPAELLQRFDESPFARKG